MENVISIIVAVLSSSALFAFVEFLIRRHDRKKSKENDIFENLVILNTKLDNEIYDRKLTDCRLELDGLMSNHPEDVRALMLVAKKYFIDLNGDWYMSTIFANHCKTHDIPLPPWFKGDGNNE